MSKGLEALKELRKLLAYEMDDINFMNECKTIEKELKVLEIVKRKIKEADIIIRKEKNYCYAWDNLMGCVLCELTESECDLLEEVLE